MSQPTPISGATERAQLPPLRGKTTDFGVIASRKVLWAPFLAIAALGAMGFLPRIFGNSALRATIWGVAGFLMLWLTALSLKLRSEEQRGRPARSLQLVLRAQHYVQAPCHLSIYLYWGYYWPPVYDYAWLIVAQLVFAYGFDMLLSWSRRENYILGFGVLPIVFSTNLFLWFKDDWFYLQFLLIAVGFMGKEFVRWTREGKSVHIFNPSAFPLALFSILLLATGTTDLTWAQQIASTLTLAPHIYVFLFAIGLIVMYFFAVTPVSATAAATLFGLSALYFSINGVPYFLDSEIPAAVFLGLHFLVSDPSTSPRTPLGRTIFGLLYGLGVFGLYGLLSAIGAPTFYDKLLCVPLLNLLVNGIDRMALRIRASVVGRAAAWDWLGRNAVQMAIWIVFFATMWALGKTDGRHVGDSLPFWEQSCRENKKHACERLLKLEATYCGDNSAWACNELGTHYTEGRLVNSDRERARSFYSKACELRFPAACANLLDPERALHAPPHTLDLRLLLREGGLNLMEMKEPDLYSRACDHGWLFACAKLGRVP